jgi:hypothetical protein
MRNFPSEDLLQHGAMRDAASEVLLVCNIRTRRPQQQNKATAMQDQKKG